MTWRFPVSVILMGAVSVAVFTRISWPKNQTLDGFIGIGVGVIILIIAFAIEWRREFS